MDLLDKLNIHSLPEQQTRLSYPNLENIFMLSKDSSNSTNDIRLGFNVCCVCAKELMVSEEVVVKKCQGCKRVNYCSSRCRTIDTNPEEGNAACSNRSTDGSSSIPQQPSALGHSALICSLLRLCNVDEMVDDKYTITNGDSDNVMLKRRKKLSITEEEWRDSEYRVRSEYESYPATLANILAEVPCYKRLFLGADQGSSSPRTLTIHIIGSQDGSELWADSKNSPLGADYTNAYVDAFTEMILHQEETNSSSFFKISTIHLVFVGPDCPSSLQRRLRTIHFGKRTSNANTTKTPIAGECQVIFDVCPQEYHQAAFSNSNSKACTTHTKIVNESGNQKQQPVQMLLPKANLVVFFNPGFTCPDYSWEKTLQYLSKTTTSPAYFLIATNTEIEAILDCQYMHRHGLITDLPSWALDHDEDCSIAGMNSSSSSSSSSMAASSSNSSHSIFFCENPYCGMRVRQSGTMANDLYVKSRWIFGGCISEKSFATSDACRGKSNCYSKEAQPKEAPGKVKKKKPPIHSPDKNDGEKRYERPLSKKQRYYAANHKSDNPALI
jgi:hypothetical protein